MALNINQFAQTPVQGEMDLQFQGSVISAQVGAAAGSPLVAGQAVKLATTAGGLPKVLPLAANSDIPFGFVARNLKDQSDPAYANLEVAMINSVMWMTAGAAITRGAKIEVSYATNKVITNAGVNPVAGFALDTAANDGDLIRVYILTQSYQSAQVIADVSGLQAALDALGTYAQILTPNVVTLAEVNAGKVLVAVPSGKKAVVTGFIARCAGAFGALTSIDIKVGATIVASLAQAQLTNGAVLIPGSAGVTLGAGFGIAGADGDDITITKVGSDGTTATSITVTPTYKIIDA